MSSISLEALTDDVLPLPDKYSVDDFDCEDCAGVQLIYRRERATHEKENGQLSPIPWLPRGLYKFIAEDTVNGRKTLCVLKVPRTIRGNTAYCTLFKPNVRVRAVGREV